MTEDNRQRKAILKRWGTNPERIPKATHMGMLNLGGQVFECAVLEDGRRVLKKNSIYKSMGRTKPNSDALKRSEEENLPVFLLANNLTPYLEGRFNKGAEIIKYKALNGSLREGYDAQMLPEACKVFVRAEDNGVLFLSQKKIAKACRAMLYSLASVGIVALIDESTNYQSVRARNELNEMLSKFLSEELMPWTKKFPDIFFKQLYRLYGWEYPHARNHPRCVSGFILKHVYGKLPEGIKEELERKNPTNENGNRTHRHHQFLSEDLGNQALQKQVMEVITVMRLSKNMDDFKKHMKGIDGYGEEKENS